MGLCDHTHWWVACDVEGCCHTTGDDYESDYEAENGARNHGFEHHPETGLWYCPEHVDLAKKPVCPGPYCPYCSGEACRRCEKKKRPSPRCRDEHGTLERHGL